MASAYEAYRDGRMREFYEDEVVDDEKLAAGLREGVLSIDTRLRDALRSLRVEGSGLEFSEPVVDESYLSELGTLEEGSVFARAQQRLEALESRVALLERTLPARLTKRFS
jgi:hypothetical protein